MLRNLSDVLSLFTIISATLYALHAFLLSLISVENEGSSNLREKIEMIRDYISNEEE